MSKLVEFPIKADIRKQLSLKDSFFKLQGDLLIQNQRLAYELVKRLQPVVKDLEASELNALALLHEIEHYLIEYYRKTLFKELFPQLEAFILKNLGKKGFNQLLQKFCLHFPPTPIFKGKQTIENYLNGKTHGVQNRYLILEEILLLWIDNSNPVFSTIKPLIDPTELKQESPFEKSLPLFKDFFKQSPPLPDEQLDLISFLQLPAKKFPHSIQAQLEFIIEHWHQYLGDFLKHILLSLDFIKEEQKARFDKASFGPGPTIVPTYEESELERFSPDQQWMPRLVLIAKSTYVWLDQLSKKYQRPITTLDQIPDKELERLARFGITGLWLIGIWERSRASQRIKQRTGNPEALASAYALYDYTIAHDLGGEQALQNLKERAWQFGIRMATDMVPNHTAIDSKWVIEHPDWFIQLPYSPFPGYTFNGPDLCDHPDVGIYIEDGYWNRTDAAVVFKRVHYPSGDTRFIYHGNDGTSMPWNDTAQLNYLNPEVRQAVLQKIIEIAKNFPIIRFDAAMTLTKKHFQRLWFPEPGSGGDIPSRAQFAMTKEEFNKHMPQEFWREVVDRVQQEVPDTLLLAEAFWLMESYFVRTLGMHRVYNSAFMNMLKNEENDKFRLLIKNTLEFNPQILKRYVNFMNNPDEETAVVQFGKGDKYFGVCTMMVTLPGLPMFGHGQLEGFAEKYGMEYRKAYWDEEEDSWLIQEHFRLIAPLLKKRYLFSDVENFFLYDVYTDQGTVNENVFAYSNRFRNEKALIIYNNAFKQAAGWIHKSAAFKSNGQLVQKELWQALNLQFPDDALIIFRDHVNGLYYIREFSEFKKRGLFIELGGYKFHVYMDFTAVFDSPEKPYRKLCQQLNGKGVPDIETALKEIIYAPLHQTLHQALNTPFSIQFKELFLTTQSITVFRKHVFEYFSLLINKISRFEKIKTSNISVKPIAEPITNYFKIAKSRYLEKNKIMLSGDETRLTKLFDLETPETEEDLKFLNTFIIYYLLDTVYQQSLNGEQFEERLLHNIFSSELEKINHLKFGNNYGLWLLQILTLNSAGLRFDRSKELKEQLVYLFKLKPNSKFTKVHTYQDIIYFNKENFEEMLFWLFVLHLLQLCKNPAKNCTKLKQSSKNFNTIIKKAFESGYQVEKFLTLLAK